MNTLIAYLQNIIYTCICLFIIRIFIVYLRIHQKKRTIRRSRVKAKIMIVLGSGGHTFEILHLIRNANEQMRPRIYVLANSDILSERKARAFEETKIKDGLSDLYTIVKITRSRDVGQSWITTCFTTIRACISSFPIVLNHMPDAILCNGPGTCVPICLSALILHVFGIKHILIIYVESICRVKTLSLSGKMLYHIADHFFVHWPELKNQYPRAEYVGRII